MTRELFVYSGRNRPDLTPAYRLFEQLTDTRVTVEKLDHQAVVPHLVREAGARGADVLVTNSQLQSDQLRRAGLLDPYAAPVAREYQPWLRADDFGWLSFTAWPRIAMINRAVLGDDPAGWPSRLEDLTGPRYTGLVASAAMREMMQPAYFSALRVVRGDEYVEGLLDRLVGNGIRIYYSNLRTRAALIEQKLAVAFVNCSNVTVFHMAGNAVGEAWLDQGDEDDGTNIEAHTVMVLRGARHPEAARDFVDFLLGAEAQTLLARLYGETPVNSGVEFPGVRPLGTIKRLNATLEQALERLPNTHDMMRARGFEILVDPEARPAPVAASR